jgi:hypothetical protein
MPVWIKFHEVDMRDGRKTRVWAVLTIDGKTVLGHVSWYGPWRKYCFSPKPQTVYEQDCLRFISSFIEDQTRKHKQSRV